MQVDFDVALDDTSKCAHKVIDLAGVSTAYCVRDTDTVDTDLVNGLVDGEQIDQV